MQRRQVKTQLKPISRWLMGVRKRIDDTPWSRTVFEKVEVKCWLFLFIHIWIIKYWINMREQRLNIWTSSDLFSNGVCWWVAVRLGSEICVPLVNYKLAISFLKWIFYEDGEARVNKSRYEFHHFDNHQNIILICSVKIKRKRDI